MRPARGDGHFPETRWSLIARLKSADEATARRALDELCAQYHYPLYCYLRRRGCGHHDAEDEGKSHALCAAEAVTGDW